MTSSSPFRLRTAIVVVSMIALPLVAVSGLKVPKFLLGGKSTTAEAKPAATSTAPRTPRDDARPGPSGTGRAPGVKPRAEIALAGGASPDAANHPVVPAANFGAHGDHDVHSDVHLTAAALHVAPNASESLTADDSGTPARMYPLPSPHAETPAETPAGAQPVPAAGSDQFSVIQQRLRALGALHYTLETWGSQGDTYRFQCRLSAGHHPNYTRHFEATDLDPLQAMQTVLADVEAWKAGRLP